MLLLSIKGKHCNFGYHQSKILFVNMEREREIVMSWSFDTEGGAFFFFFWAVVL